MTHSVIANYLKTIVISGYWDAENWRSWADEIILLNDELDFWIFEVAFATNIEEFYSAIDEEIRNMVFDKNTFYWEPDVVVGYYYLMYKENKIDLSELFLKFIDEDDISHESELFDNSDILYMVNQARINGIDKIDTVKLDELLIPFANTASKQLEELMHYKRI